MNVTGIGSVGMDERLDGTSVVMHDRPIVIGATASIPRPIALSMLQKEERPASGIAVWEGHSVFART